MMTTKIRKIRILMFCLTLALLAGMSQLARPAAGALEQVGLLTVTGTVRINGKPAATGDIVVSGSEVQTAKGSSAVVSLGDLGRVEAMASTTMKVRYEEYSTSHTSASVSILLGDGSVRVSTVEGMDGNVETGRTSTRPITRKQQSVFTVDVTCGNTFVSVAKGTVELREGIVIKEIPAGGQDTAGRAKPGCTPSRKS
jgi:hypothetical protein